MRADAAKIPLMALGSRLSWPAIVALGLALACNLPSRQPPSASAVPPAATDRPASAPTPTPTEPPLPASDLASALYAGVESGRWSRSEGAITMMKLLAGEIPADRALTAEGVVRGEGTRVLSLAHQLLGEAETTAEERAEIGRLLTLLLPSVEDLDSHAQTESISSQRPAGAAAPPWQDEDCETIWREDWVPDPLTTCFLRRDLEPHRIYYPVTWSGDPDRLLYVDAAEEALRTSHEAYTRLGLRVPTVHLVFSLLTADRFGGSRSWYAAASSWMSPCPILVYPSGLDPDLERYKQILAHEMFHCVQGVNLANQMSVGTPTYDWWVEGTAEYFANVAFPDADAENEYLGAFDENSFFASLVEMDYEDFLFFQHWANEAGNAAVVGFLRGLPTAGGREEQRAALAAAPEIQDRFHRFGQLYLDKNIPDAGGDLVPVNPSLETIEIEESTFDVIPPSPDFVLKRYGLLYRKDRMFENTLGQEGGEGMSSARPAGEGEWGRLPDDVRTGCSPQGYVLLVTTANAAGEDHHFLLDVLAEETRGCDECLIGRWSADVASLQEYFSLRSAAESAPEIEEVGGGMWAEFRENNTSEWGYNELEIEFLQSMTDFSGNPLNLRTILRFTGGGTAVYHASGSLLDYEDTSYDIQVGVTVAGQEITLADESVGLAGAEPGGDIFSGGVPYVCHEDEARFGPVEGAPTDVILWRRGGP